MAKYCAVPGCGNASRTGSSLSFFKFPTNPKLLAKWNNAIKRKGFRSTSKHTFVCSEHFTEADFQVRPTACVKLLKDNAVPAPFYNKCAFLGCSSVQGEGSPFQFFKFPSVIEPARQLWIAATGRKDFIPNNSSRICSAHFTLDQVLNQIVRHGAVPTAANPQSQTSQEAQVVSSESERIQVTKRTEVDPAKKQVIGTGRKTAVVSEKEGSDSENLSKELNSNAKRPIKMPVARSITGPDQLSNRRKEKQTPDETLIVEVKHSGLPTTKNDEDELLHYAFVREGLSIFCFKFIRDGGVEVDSTEGKEYDRMAQRIVDSIKDFRILSKINKSLKKLKILMTCLPLVATNDTEVYSEKNNVSNAKSKTDIVANSKAQPTERKQKEKNNPNSKINKNSCVNDSGMVSRDVVTPEDPLAGAQIETNEEEGNNKNISMNFCHDHTYITTPKTKATKAKTAKDADLSAEICCQLKKNKLPRSDNLFRTRALKKIEDFKTNAKRKNEANRKLREKIRELQYKLRSGRITKPKVLKKRTKSANEIHLRNPLGDDEFFDDYASVDAPPGWTVGAATGCMSGESNLKEVEDMEEDIDEEVTPICDIYICEPAM